MTIKNQQKQMYFNEPEKQLAVHTSSHQNI